MSDIKHVVLYIKIYNIAKSEQVLDGIIDFYLACSNSRSLSDIGLIG